jgi:hypothetical protein
MHGDSSARLEFKSPLLIPNWPQYDALVRGMQASRLAKFGEALQ